MTVNVDSPPVALPLVLFSALMVGSIHEEAGRGPPGPAGTWEAAASPRVPVGLSPAGPGPRPPG
ncbi:hypothetical protein GCM10018966_089570 [Streptomyces yanii]